MQSTDIKEIKAALWRQAFIGDTWVSCAMGRVVAIKMRKGKLQVMILGWKRWHEVEGVIVFDDLVHTFPRWQVSLTQNE